MDRFGHAGSRYNQIRGVMPLYREENLDVLCDPYTHHPLQLLTDGQADYLTVPSTGRRYPIVDQIPEFITQADITGSNQKMSRFYHRIAPYYDLVMRIFYWFFGGDTQARMEYLKHLEIHEGDKVLEVSVGTGANIRCLPRTAQYFGLDISADQLRQCRKNKAKYNMDIELFLGNAEHLPFKDEAFDVVFHAGGINFFSDKKRAIDEMVRVAKKGSKLLIADETEKALKTSDKYAGRMSPVKNRTAAISAPVALLPATVTDVEVSEIHRGVFYCLVFRKT